MVKREGEEVVAAAAAAVNATEGGRGDVEEAVEVEAAMLEVEAVVAKAVEAMLGEVEAAMLVGVGVGVAAAVEAVGEEEVAGAAQIPTWALTPCSPKQSREFLRPRYFPSSTRPREKLRPGPPYSATPRCPRELLGVTQEASVLPPPFCQIITQCP